ncbi:hypothetical protein EBM89_03915 [Cellulomonas triticagri]|uniref:Alanine and proline-rich secreted protein Apa n=1 Tax=Cellulomonas triticagri TaxID=2483352 RepID=A0A3M2JS56_9CELL|nr:hypothetical protein EBM89_03915 [Cellulomonas triticagri]
MVGGVLALVLLRPGPVLLDPDEFVGVTRVEQNSHVPPPGWTGCDLSVGPWMSVSSPDTDTALELGPHGRAGAAIVVQPSWSPRSAPEQIEHLSMLGEQCAAGNSVSSGRFAIEPLDGLAPGEVGWRTRYEEPLEWGEYVVVALDEKRLLAVGFETTEEEPPVDMEHLVERAKQGAEQFPAGG